MIKYMNKFIRVITIYGEEIMGIVVGKPIFVLQLKTNNGILVIDLEDIEDIIEIGEVIEEEK